MTGLLNAKIVGISLLFRIIFLCIPAVGRGRFHLLALLAFFKSVVGRGTEILKYWPPSENETALLCWLQYRGTHRCSSEEHNKPMMRPLHPTPICITPPHLLLSLASDLAINASLQSLANGVEYVLLFSVHPFISYVARVGKQRKDYHASVVNAIFHC